MNEMEEAILKRETDKILKEMNDGYGQLDKCPICGTGDMDFKRGEIESHFEFNQASNYVRCLKCSAWWLEEWEYKRATDFEFPGTVEG